MARPKFPGSNIVLVKAHNMRAILLNFLYEGSMSRVQLARKTSLSSTTISNLINELIDQGIVVEEGIQEPDGRRRVGRPRTGLRMVPDARYAVGVHIGIGLLRIAITDLYAQILHNNFVTYDIEDPVETVLNKLALATQKTIRQSRMDPERILGVGVGASGLVDYDTGVNILAPNLKWHNVPIREILRSTLDLPVIVDNNVRAMALGEAMFGAGRGVNSLAFVYGRIGVGAGLVVEDKVFRGSSAGAGEIGHNTMIPNGGEQCRCGKLGCLETLVSEPVLIKNAEKIAQEVPDSLIANILANGGTKKPSERIFTAARQGDPYAREIVNQLSCYLGLALANLVNVINPELILLGGMFAQGEDLILPAAQKSMRESAFAGMGEKVKLQPSSFGWRAGVIGASALALNTFFYQQPEEI